jgi:hypothetical protein
MKKHSIRTAALAFGIMAKRFPKSYIRILKLGFGYDLLIVRRVTERSNDIISDGRNSSGSNLRSL